MANTKSAKKRARQTPKKTAVNTAIRSRVRRALSGARDAFATGNKESADFLKTAISQLSKAANKGVVHKRNAARRISRLMKAATKTVVAPVAKAKAAKTTKAKSAKTK